MATGNRLAGGAHGIFLPDLWSLELARQPARRRAGHRVRLGTRHSFPDLDDHPVFGHARVLRVFDMPFNQAPSLHIATTTILFDLYSRVLPRWTLPVTALAALLVGASVLTTYQHHFIDVPTGFLLGLL